MEATGKRQKILRVLVKIVFEDSELARVCNSAAARRSAFGEDLSNSLLRRLLQIEAADRLTDLRHLAAARLRQGPPGTDPLTRLISVGFHGDLIVRPRDDPPALLDDGSLDEHSVHALVVTALQLRP
jgi:plasmid maintenance system killer protein